MALMILFHTSKNWSRKNLFRFSLRDLAWLFNYQRTDVPTHFVRRYLFSSI